jgi:hypothetical protein
MRCQPQRRPIPSAAAPEDTKPLFHETLFMFHFAFAQTHSARTPLALTIRNIPYNLNPFYKLI